MYLVISRMPDDSCRGQFDQVCVVVSLVVCVTSVERGYFPLLSNDNVVTPTIKEVIHR